MGLDCNWLPVLNSTLVTPMSNLFGKKSDIIFTLIFSLHQSNCKEMIFHDIFVGSET